MNNEAKKCESCGITDDDQKLLECAGCLSAYFCSTSCQQQSWRLHKKICRQRKKSVIKIQSNWRGYESRQQLMHINDDDGRPRCEVCGITNSKTKQLHICNGCKVSLFCSKKCQDYAWKKRGHREFCLERQRAAVTVQRLWRRKICQRVRRREEITRRREEMKRGIMAIKRVVVNMVHMVVWTVETMKDMIMSVKNAMVNVMSSIILGLIQAAGAMKGIMMTVYHKSGQMARVLALLGIFYFIHFFYVTYICLRIYYGVMGKWEAQWGESTGFFYRFDTAYVLICHPYDAFTNPTWKVNWDENLDKDEVGFVHEFSDVFAKRFMSYSKEFHGHTVVDLPNGKAASLAWDDLPAYTQWRKLYTYDELKEMSALGWKEKISKSVPSFAYLSYEAADHYKTIYKEKLDEQMMNKIRRKWEMQKESKGFQYLHRANEGYLYCYVDEFGHLPCDPYDAFNWNDLYGEFSTHKWEVDWDTNLEEYEVMYVHSNREKIIGSSLYLSTGLQGYTVLTSPYDEYVKENYKQVAWEDISKYLSLKKVLTALDLDNVYTIVDHASYLYAVKEYSKLLTNAATPFREVLLTSKNLISITKLLSFDDYQSGLFFEAAVLLNQIMDYMEKLKLSYQRDRDKTKRILDELVFDEGAGVTLHLVHVLLRYLLSNNALVNETSTRLLGLISMTSPKFRDAMLSDGATRLVLNNILKPRSESHFLDSLETFFWLCRGEVPPMEEVKVISPVLTKVITKYDSRESYFALLTLQRILSGGHDYAMALIDTGVVTNLLEFIKSKRFINVDRESSLSKVDLQSLALDIVESIVRLPSLALDVVESITAEL